MANVIKPHQNPVVVISPLHLRHRLFVAQLEKNLIKVAAIVVDKSRPKSYFRSYFSLSNLLNLVLTVYESFKFGLSSIRNIPVYGVSSLADPRISEIVNSTCPRTVIVYGGKIIPKATLDNLAYPCINVHASVLPGYRGLDSYWWSLAENNQDSRGYSVHFVDSGIDSGNLLLVKPYTAKNGLLSPHLSWRIWIAYDSAKEISKIVSEEKLALWGIPHAKTASTYRSKIRLIDVIRARSKLLLVKLHSIDS